MHTYHINDDLQITLLEDRLSFKNFVVTSGSGAWPELDKAVNFCETGYQHAKIDFFPQARKAFIRVYTD